LVRSICKFAQWLCYLFADELNKHEANENEYYTTCEVYKLKVENGRLFTLDERKNGEFESQTNDADQPYDEQQRIGEYTIFE
jgi:hypothetical protein